ncbi:hypothetical protein ACLOJK_004584 [Asimina triloba]
MTLDLGRWVLATGELLPWTLFGMPARSRSRRSLDPCCDRCWPAEDVDGFAWAICVGSHHLDVCDSLDLCCCLLAGSGFEDAAWGCRTEAKRHRSSARFVCV